MTMRAVMLADADSPGSWRWAWSRGEEVERIARASHAQPRESYPKIMRFSGAEAIL